VASGDRELKLYTVRTQPAAIAAESLFVFIVLSIVEHKKQK